MCPPWSGHSATIWRKCIPYGALTKYSSSPESFDVKTEDCWQSPDTELLGAGLLGLATLAVEPLTVSQLLHLNKLLQTVVDIANW